MRAFALATVAAVLGLGALAGALLTFAATPAEAQYAAPGWRGDDGRNPLDDFFARMDRNNPNPTLHCQTYKRLNRNGEIVWMRLECRA